MLFVIQTILMQMMGVSKNRAPISYRRFSLQPNAILLLNGSKEREALGVGSIPVAILPSCHDMKTMAV